MTNFSIIAIVILVFLFILIYKAIEAIAKKSHVMKMQAHQIYGLLLAYILLLLVVAGLYFTLIQPKLPEYDASEMPTDEINYRSEKEMMFADMTPELLRKSWEIDVQDNQFRIETNLTEEELWERNYLLLIERTDEPGSNRIVARQYQAKAYLNIPAYIDVTDIIPTEEVVYSSSHLEVNQKVEQPLEVNIGLILNPFILTQFQPETSILYDTSDGYSAGAMVQKVFLTIPQHIELHIDDELDEIVEVYEE